MKKIVLVEDDVAIRDAFSIALDQNHYELYAFESGDSILEKQVIIPDLFLLDKNIAGTSGLELCRFIKSDEIYQHTPVVILSASPDIKSQAQKAGADDIIRKPFSLKVLREVIAKYT